MEALVSLARLERLDKEEIGEEERAEAAVLRAERDREEEELRRQQVIP